MKGVILAGGSGTRLSPLTNVMSKQLLPVYDKPMIYYPLSTLIHAGVSEILVISTPSDISKIEALLGDGRLFGLSISYLIQQSPEGLAQGVDLASDFTQSEEFWFILGDNFYHGPAFGANLRELSSRYKGRALAFAYRVTNPNAYGVVEFSADGFSVERLIEKPKSTHPGWAVPGLYKLDSRASAYFKDMQKSTRGEYEILDLLDCYLKENLLSIEKVSRGNAWFDLGTTDNLHTAAQFVHLVQSRQGQLIGSPEEATLRAGFISSAEMKDLLEERPNSGYYEMLRNYLL